MYHIVGILMSRLIYIDTTLHVLSGQMANFFLILRGCMSRDFEKKMYMTYFGKNEEVALESFFTNFLWIPETFVVTQQRRLTGF